MIKTAEKARAVQTAFHARHKVGLAPAVRAWVRTQARVLAEEQMRKERLPALPGLLRDLEADHVSALTRSFPRHWNAWEADQARLVELRAHQKAQA